MASGRKSSRQAASVATASRSGSGRLLGQPLAREAQRLERRAELQVTACTGARIGATSSKRLAPAGAETPDRSPVDRRPAVERACWRHPLPVAAAARSSVRAGADVRGLEQLVRHGVGEQRMPEPQPVVVGLLDHPPGDEATQMGEHLGLGQLGQLDEHVERHRCAVDAERLDHGALARGEIGELLAHRLLERPRQLGVDDVLAAGPGTGTADQLFDHERDTTAAAMHRLDRCR